MDKQKCKVFRDKFAEAVKGLEKELDCTIAIGNITFNPQGLSTKLTLTEDDENGEKVSQASLDFKRCAPLYGLKPEDLGEEFLNGADTFKITGCQPKAKKYAILGENVKTGKVLRFTVDGVKFGMKMLADRKQRTP